MNPWFLVHAFFCTVWSDNRRSTVETPTVPNTTNISSRNDLREPASLDMPDFDESCVEQQHIRCMHRHAICLPFPLNDTRFATWMALPIDEQTEF
jgi:hypothetical protein